MDTLNQCFDRVLNEYNSARTEIFAKHSLAKFIREDFVSILRNIINDRSSNTLYSIKGHPGQGGWAAIPWIEITNSKFTKSVQTDIYPAYLFKSDCSGFYLSLQQGITGYPSKSHKETIVNNTRSFLLSHIPEMQNWDTGKLDFSQSSEYENTNYAAKFYSKENIPNDETLIRDLTEMLFLYNKVSALNQKQELEQKMDKMPKNAISLPKPFLLLAGISGTGKSRFVRKQAEQAGKYQLVAVRPDWYEPADLLGYVSRLSGKAEYVITDVLKFIIEAWQAVEKAGLIATNQVSGNLSQLQQVEPYWLCLDEMNLAPVEQYFADYLSVIETRKWEWEDDNFSYSTDALLSPTAWEEIDNFKDKLSISDELWQFFNEKGIGIPFNLIVAGTVNMDETTHAFSRKVLDRALSFDFSKFYPNDFDAFFEPRTQPKLLSYPIYSQAKREQHSDKSIAFLVALNEVLKNTPFELAYRALNELLLTVSSFNPQNDQTLQAIWDDFVMTKVLPRIEGDEVKVSDALDNLEKILEQQFDLIWENDRPDLWRDNLDGSPLLIGCRSKPKLARMRQQLQYRGMVSFW